MQGKREHILSIYQNEMRLMIGLGNKIQRNQLICQLALDASTGRSLAFTSLMLLLQEDTK